MAPAPQEPASFATMALARALQLDGCMTTSTAMTKHEPQTLETWTAESGKVGWALAWLLGVPLPLLLVIYLFTRAC